MNFARWETIENMKKLVPLTAIDGKNDVNASGIPMAYDDDNLYICGRQSHSLVIGSTGSGKTQAITLPMLELACMSGESVVVHDTKNELYETTNQMFKDYGYNVVRLNFDDGIDSGCWNPLDLPFKLYKDGNTDKAQDLISDLGYYLLTDGKYKTNEDPFWINSATNYFTGLVLYLFETEKNVNLDKLVELDNYVRDNTKEFLKKSIIKSNIYINLRGVLEAPNDTRGSILSVFDQKINYYISKQKLLKLLSKSDFDISSIAKEKTIVYIISGNSNVSKSLLPLFISQVYYAKDEYSRKNGKINIIIDDFFEFYPIRNFSKLLNYSRGIGIILTIMVRGFNDLRNVYGSEETEIIKLCFSNLIYLLSQDINTLEEISNMCGKTSIIDNKAIPLISVEELKTLKVFEAIILTPRIMPFKTKLLPYYEIKR